jgi:hypothetical protein
VLPSIKSIPPKVLKWYLQADWVKYIFLGQFDTPQDAPPAFSDVDLLSPTEASIQTLQIPIIPCLFQSERAGQQPVQVVYLVKNFMKIWNFLLNRYEKLEDQERISVFIIVGPPGIGKSLMI